MEKPRRECILILILQNRAGTGLRWVVTAAPIGLRASCSLNYYNMLIGMPLINNPLNDVFESYAYTRDALTVTKLLVDLRSVNTLSLIHI